MNKVICDICGTSYPETAEQCPICGYSSTMDEFVMENVRSEGGNSGGSGSGKQKAGRFSSTNVRKREKTVPVQPEPDEDAQDDPDEYEEESRRTNPLVVVLLVVLIMAMLTVTGFLFFRFFLPNVGREETRASTSEETTTLSAEETTEEITEEPTVPCESLVLLNEPEVSLEGIGQYYLIHVEYAPADTTDKVEYTSSDETIAVVNNEGRVEVTGEGVATITVTCGSQQVECVLTCLPEQEEPTDETTEETVESAEATEESTAGLDIELYLDKKDFTLSFRGDFYQLKFNPELSAQDITWISANPNVATVENGLVTCVSYGTTKITAKYGDQEVVCIVRCVW